MNKSELIDAVASKAGITKADAKRAIDIMIKAGTDALAKGDKVAIRNVGSFEVRSRSERTGRNPQTGKTITIPEKKVVRFKANCPPL